MLYISTYKLIYIFLLIWNFLVIIINISISTVNLGFDFFINLLFIGVNIYIFTNMIRQKKVLLALSIEQYISIGRLIMISLVAIQYGTHIPALFSPVLHTLWRTIFNLGINSSLFYLALLLLYSFELTNYLKVNRLKRALKR